MSIKELKEKLFKNESFCKEYDRYDLPFEIGEMVIDARVKLGITQKELARMAKTKQPSIARLENGTTLPSLSFLEKIAKSMGTYLLAPKFAFLEENVSQTITSHAPPLVSSYLAHSGVLLADILHPHATQTLDKKSLNMKTETREKIHAY